MSIDTERVSEKYRSALIKPLTRELLITNFYGTEQEKDLSEPANCKGFGRIRHFRRGDGQRWPRNPLPLDPVCRALRLQQTNVLRAQVFQNAACNWRCWYCFVPFNLLSANLNHAAWLTPQAMIDLYLAQEDPPQMIDLTGGQPDLTPEWIPWMMEELKLRGLEHTTYLWSDDNLSNDYFWRYLSDDDRQIVLDYPNYSRVCCIKGFNAESFTFNTKAHPDLFHQQFNLLQRLIKLGLDIYLYTTFTTPTISKIDDIKPFIDKLQIIDEFLPLRTVPLEIAVFNPVQDRLNDEYRKALIHQYHVIEAWNKEIVIRFSSEQRNLNIVDVPLRGIRKYG